MAHTVRILLAEDDDDDYLIFQDAVKEMPMVCEIIRSKNGIELMQHLKEDIGPDIVFLDINMPKKNGFECITEIRAIHKYDRIPVIIFSTSSSNEIVERMYKARANAFMVKPNNFSTWINNIKKAIETNWKENDTHKSISNFVFSET
jgi:DNA-binding NtrC family response regulator